MTEKSKFVLWVSDSDAESMTREHMQRSGL